MNWKVIRAYVIAAVMTSAVFIAIIYGTNKLMATIDTSAMVLKIVPMNSIYNVRVISEPEASLDGSVSVRVEREGSVNTVVFTAIADGTSKLEFGQEVKIRLYRIHTKQDVISVWRVVKE